MDKTTHKDPKSKLRFRISSKISKSDIKQLAYIHVEALRDDDSATVKFADKDEFRCKIQEMLEGQLIATGMSVRPEFTTSCVDQWFIIKASLIDSSEYNESEKIIGWASWLHEGSESGTVSATRMLVSDQGNSKENNQKLLQFNHGLGAFVRRHQTRIYAEWCSKRSEEASEYLSLRACFILPEFQRCGVGGALVRYGCERADLLGLDTLVTSTQVAKSLYESVGKFEVFEQLEVNLNDFDDKTKRHDSQGQESARNYRFWFLARIHGGWKHTAHKD
ncbi:hypothetical protein LTR84_003581 [Exophiala bonariae]|uniref:N-acetyltransferase domain-containing protein n=1 Tax=Exophiala bonariae TaxID=1690606 RepID=A0AAV9N7L5_9EURO|nr:hypothetical protein LTR84_003581 [Exophiala bonariae]